jgi:hypothetical protein
MAVMHEEELVAAPAMADPGNGAPSWLIPELPDQYADIARQIADLREQARAFEVVAGVLWQTGPALIESVCDLFGVLDFATVRMPSEANYDVCVDLGNERRLLIDVVSEPQTLDRRSPHIARILKVLQQEAGEKDRVLLAANVFPTVPPSARRGEPVTPDAMRLIQGLGANFVPTSALFGIWKSSLADMTQARNRVMNIFAMDGGIFR